jgi:hypothetical protein
MYVCVSLRARVCVCLYQHTFGITALVHAVQNKLAELTENMQNVVVVLLLCLWIARHVGTEYHYRHASFHAHLGNAARAI